MDNLASKVANIESGLHNHRGQLQTIEANARESIGGELKGMQTALTNGDGKIQYVTSQVDSCVGQIGYHSDLSSIDLKPQITWLSTRIGEIVSEYETAQLRAQFALYNVNDCTYKVMDVGQEVNASRDQLAQAEADGEAIAQKAQEELSTSERLLATTQSNIASKESEIRRKTTEATAKRERKRQLDTDVADKNRRIREAERQREKKKDAAIISGGIGLLGIILAPVTFGTSLALTAGAGVGVGINLADVSNLKDEIRSINRSISSVQSEIAQADRDVIILEREKEELQRLVTRYQSEVTTRRGQQQEFRSEIEKTDRIKSEISVLGDHATSTISSVTESKIELQTIKQNLDTFSALLKEQSLEMQTNSGFLERFLGKTYQRKQEFKRQLALMTKATETLCRIRTQTLALLPSPETKLLGSSPWTAAIKSAVDVSVSSPIPDLCNTHHGY